MSVSGIIRSIATYYVVSRCETSFLGTQSHQDPYFHTIGERGFAIQTYLHVPPQIGFFSPEPGRMRGVEGLLLARIVCSTAFVYLCLGILAICLRGGSEELRRVLVKAAWLFPVVFIATAWITMFLVSRTVTPEPVCCGRWPLTSGTFRLTSLKAADGAAPLCKSSRRTDVSFSLELRQGSNLRLELGRSCLLPKLTPSSVTSCCERRVRYPVRHDSLRRSSINQASAMSRPATFRT